MLAIIEINTKIKQKAKKVHMNLSYRFLQFVLNTSETQIAPLNEVGGVIWV